MKRGSRIFKRIKKLESLTDIVYAAIKEAIVSVKLRPMEKLNISKIAYDLGVSTTPVREALNRLINEGLVANVPFKGLFVANVSEDDVRQLLEVRKMLELAAISKAAPRIEHEDIKIGESLISEMKRAFKRKDIPKYIQTSLDFHMLYINKCENQIIIEFLTNFNDKVKRIAFLAIEKAEKIPPFIHDYEKILEALRRKDGNQAQELLRLHLERVEKSLYLREQTPEKEPQISSKENIIRSIR